MSENTGKPIDFSLHIGANVALNGGEEASILDVNKNARGQTIVDVQYENGTIASVYPSQIAKVMGMEEDILNGTEEAADDIEGMGGNEELFGDELGGEEFPPEPESEEEEDKNKKVERTIKEKVLNESTPESDAQEAIQAYLGDDLKIEGIYNINEESSIDEIKDFIKTNLRKFPRNIYYSRTAQEGYPFATMKYKEISRMMKDEEDANFGIETYSFPNYLEMFIGKDKFNQVFNKNKTEKTMADKKNLKESSMSLTALNALKQKFSEGEVLISVAQNMPEAFDEVIRNAIAESLQEHGVDKDQILNAMNDVADQAQEAMLEIIEQMEVKIKDANVVDQALEKIIEMYTKAAGVMHESAEGGDGDWRKDLETWDEKWKETWEERAAIKEFDGNMEREAAEKEAYDEVKAQKAGKQERTERKPMKECYTFGFRGEVIKVNDPVMDISTNRKGDVKEIKPDGSAVVVFGTKKETHKKATLMKI